MSLAAPPRQRPSRSGDSGWEDTRPGGGGGNGWVLLVVARNGLIAHLIGGLLKEEGIEFTLDTSNPSPGAWLHPFGDPAAPVKVMVRQRDLAMAGALIARSEDGSAYRSIKAEGPLRRRNAKAALMLTVTLALFIGFLEVVGFAPCFLRLFCF